MKEYLKSVVIAGVAFGLFMGLFMGLINGFYAGLVGGAVSGSLFGVLIYIFMNIQKKKLKKLSMEITKGKKIIKDGGANHFRGVEGVGGWLILTPDEVIFKSHAFNVQNHKTIIPLDEIVEVKAVLTARVIPNGLLITNKEGAINQFVVNGRNEWVQKINEAISSIHR